METLVVDAIREFGALGVMFLMFAENVFPPIPSEVIMPLAGFMASSGDMNLAAVIIAGTGGSVAGATIWFYVGRLIPVDRLRRLIAHHGAWLAMTPADLERAEKWFEKHGTISVFLGRLVPIVRTLISVPAGVTRMPIAVFLLYTTVGSAVWTTALAMGGWILQREFRDVERYLGVASWVVIGILVLAYVIRVIRLRRAGRRQHPGPDEKGDDGRSAPPASEGPSGK